MRVGALFIIGLAAGCSNKVVVECNLDHFANADVAGRSDIMHCEQVLVNPDAGAGASAWAAAQKCVLDAVAGRQGFILNYDFVEPQFNQHLGAAFTGYPSGGGRLVVHAFAFSGDKPMHAGDANPTVSQLSCNGEPPLTDTNANPMTPCTPDVGRACLTCNSKLAGALLCGFQP